MENNVNIALPVPVEEILESIGNVGFEAYVVGGCVRDSLLGREPSDWDICTDALPHQVMEMFYEVIPTGLEYGTVTVIIDGEGFEVTTFRSDGRYSDGRHPDSVSFSESLEEDLSRRDFTINAMAYNPQVGLVDLYNGQEHLKQEAIWCVGFPDDRFQEDPLRMLRAIRFSAQLDFRLHPSVRNALKENSELLRVISFERIQSEFNKILMTEFAREHIENLHYYGLLETFIPELCDLYDLQQNNRFHCYDVFEHTMTALEFAPNNLEVRLAVLFHDLGKALTHTVDENGYDHFYAHEDFSADMTSRVMNRLRYGRAVVSRVSGMVRHHQLRVVPSAKSVKRALNKIDGCGFSFRELISVQIADDSAKNLSNSSVANRLGNFSKVLDVYEEVLTLDECFSVAKLAVNGTDVLNAGYPAGVVVGDILEYLVRLVIAVPERNTREYLLDVIEITKDFFGGNCE